MTGEGMAFDGGGLGDDPSTEVFEAYLERFLAPELRRGHVAVTDNLGARKPRRVEESIEGRGCELLYPPAYSPDYNPIEEAFSKITGFLREARARTSETPVEAMGRAPSAVRSLGAQGFFEHVGDRTVGQLP